MPLSTHLEYYIDNHYLSPDKAHLLSIDEIALLTNPIIRQLVTDESITVDEACTLTHEQLALIKSVYNREVTADSAIRAHPQNSAFVTAIYKFDPSAIQKLEASKVIELVDNYKIDLKDALKAFPDNQSLIQKAAVPTFISSKQQVIALITNGKLDPLIAVSHYPQNKSIVTAAYHKNPTSLKKASRELINELGLAGEITIEEVLSIFSLSMPSEATLQQTSQRYEDAIEVEDWITVADICQKFWFEKPEVADLSILASDLMAIGRPDILFELEEAIKKANYQLSHGPLVKVQETYQLEELTRKLIRDGDFVINTIDGVDYFEFADGERFNWTLIRDHADLQHISLSQEDLDAYNQFEDSDIPHTEVSKLNESKADYYRDQLYETSEKQGKTRPNPPISFAEMRAINIYSSGFYSQMNGLMRGDLKKFNHRKADKSVTREALIRSVVCASGLRKLPETTIKESYRGASLGSKQAQQQRMKAAATKGIEKLDGFISTSTSETVVQKAFDEKPVIYKFRNLRGAYIAPISVYPEEEEFLIPQTQVQITHYSKTHEGKDYFEASVVSDLETSLKDGFKPLVIESALQYASPEKVIELIASGDIEPSLAVASFPENKAVVKAALDKYPSPTVLRLSTAQVALQLLASNEITPFFALLAFPENTEVIQAAFDKEPSATLLKKADPESLYHLARSGDITLDIAFEAFSKQLIDIAIVRDDDPMLTRLLQTEQVSEQQLSYAFNKACEYQRQDLIKLLLDHPKFDANDILSLNKKDPGFVAAMGSPDIFTDVLNHPKVDSELLKQKDSKDHGLIFHALNQIDNASGLLKILLEDPKYPPEAIKQQDIKGNHALHLAIELNKPKSVPLLMANAHILELLDTPNLASETVLNLALKANNDAAIEVLRQPAIFEKLSFDKGLSILQSKTKSFCLLTHLSDDITNLTNDTGQTLLHVVCERGDIDAILNILHSFSSGKQLLTIKDSLGDTPLHKFLKQKELFSDTIFAELYFDRRIFANLIDTPNFDINTNNKLGQSPLHIACQSGNIEAVVSLINHNANINTTNELGESPLHIACQYGNIEAAMLLIRNGANINLQDNHGMSPLMIAAKQYYSILTDILITNGARPNQVNSEGRTALYFAVDDENLKNNDFPREGRFRTPEDQQLTVVQSLVKEGATVRLEKAVGQSVISLADKVNAKVGNYIKDIAKLEKYFAKKQQKYLKGLPDGSPSQQLRSLLQGYLPSAGCGFFTKKKNFTDTIKMRNLLAEIERNPEGAHILLINEINKIHKQTPKELFQDRYYRHLRAAINLLIDGPDLNTLKTRSPKR